MQQGQESSKAAESPLSLREPGLRNQERSQRKELEQSEQETDTEASAPFLP